MHEALSALLDYAFTESNLNRVEADTDPRNERSARVLDRLKFSKEGLFRERCIVDGEISDAAMYGLPARMESTAIARCQPAGTNPSIWTSPSVQAADVGDR